MMTREEFVSTFRTLLRNLEEIQNEMNWVAIAEHIDGTNLNYEECLISMAELSALDENEMIPWTVFVWVHVHELFPENIDALEAVCDFYVSIVGDMEAAEPFVKRLRALSPDNAVGLNADIIVNVENENKSAAEEAMFYFCKTDPKAAMFYGSFDYFEDLDFLKPIANEILTRFGEPSGRYNRSLKQRIEQLVE